jgi:hypothetical protein
MKKPEYLLSQDWTPQLELATVPGKTAQADRIVDRGATTPTVHNYA